LGCPGIDLCILHAEIKLSITSNEGTVDVGGVEPDQNMNSEPVLLSTTPDEPAVEVAGVDVVSSDTYFSWYNPATIDVMCGKRNKDDTTNQNDDETDDDDDMDCDSVEDPDYVPDDHSSADDDDDDDADDSCIEGERVSMRNVMLSGTNEDLIVPCSDESSESFVIPFPDLSKHLGTTGSLPVPHSSTVSTSEMSVFEPVDNTALPEENLDGQDTGSVSADANKVVVITTNNHGHRRYDKKIFVLSANVPRRSLQGI